MISRFYIHSYNYNSPHPIVVKHRSLNGPNQRFPSRGDALARPLRFEDSLEHGRDGGELLVNSYHHQADEKR